MEAESFTHPEVIKFLQDRFIPIRTNVDKDKKIASAYYVRALPTSWFLEPNGSKITSIPGYTNPETFMVVMKYVVTESYKRMTLREFYTSLR